MRLNAETVHTTRVDDQTVVLDTLNSDYLTVNATGTVILDLLRHDVTLNELAASLVETFEVDLAQAHRDSEAFVAELERRGWLLPGRDLGEPTDQ